MLPLCGEIKIFQWVTTNLFGYSEYSAMHLFCCRGAGAAIPCPRDGLKGLGLSCDIRAATAPSQQQQQQWQWRRRDSSCNNASESYSHAFVWVTAFWYHCHCDRCQLTKKRKWTWDQLIRYMSGYQKLQNGACSRQSKQTDLMQQYQPLL